MKNLLVSLKTTTKMRAKKIFLIAHAGAMNTEENSLASLCRLSELSYVNAVEIDVCETKDRFFIMRHDPFFHNEGHLVEINDCTFSELPKYIQEKSLSSGLELLRQRDVFINLDLKNVRSYGLLDDLVKKVNLFDKVFISGCDLARCQRIRTQNLEFKLLVNIEPENLKSKQDLETLIKSVEELEVNGVNIPYEYCSKSLVARMKANEIPIYVWTVDDFLLAKKLIAFGVDAITSHNLEMVSTIQ